MTTQTTEFLVSEIIRIHANLYAVGKPKYSNEACAEQRETLATAAEELARRVERGDLKDRRTALQDWP